MRWSLTSTMEKYENNTNPLYRIGEIFSVLSNTQDQISLSWISEILHIPLGIIRYDFYVIASAPEFSSVFGINGKSFEEFFDPNGYEKPAHFFKGYYDDLALSLSQDALKTLFPNSGNETIRVLQTTEEEALELKNMVKEKIPECIIKNLSYPSPPDNEENAELKNGINKIQSVIDKQASLRAMGNVYYPISIYYDIITSNSYMVCIQDNDIHFTALSGDFLDTLSRGAFHMSRTDTKAITADTVKKAKNLLKYIWEPETVSLSEKPVDVKLLINRTEQNTYEKFIKDISHHDNTEEDNVLREIDDKYSLYSTHVIGMKAFTSWVVSYGSSVIVLEPLSLKERVIEIYKNIKEKYS